MRLLGKQSGVAALEFVPCFVVFLLALLCFLQVMVLFQARSNLDVVAYYAARGYATSSSLQTAQQAGSAYWTRGGQLNIGVVATNTPIVGNQCIATATVSYPLFNIPLVTGVFSNASGGAFQITSSCVAPMAQ